MTNDTHQIDEDRFLIELDNISKYCAAIAQEYALLRGAMNSLEGLEKRFPDGNNLTTPVIMFFNETSYLRKHKLVGVVWALSEKTPHSRINLSSLSSDTVKKTPTDMDKVKFSGDMTLMRMRDMYRRAIKLYPDILLKKARLTDTIISDVEIEKLASETANNLSLICNDIDDHLSDDGEWHKVDYFRNSFAHSLQHPRVAFTNNWTDSAPEFTYNELYIFGDRAANLAIEFHRTWNFSRICSGVDELMERTEKDYAQFWEGFFKNPHFSQDNAYRNFDEIT